MDPNMWFTRHTYQRHIANRVIPLITELMKTILLIDLRENRCMPNQTPSRRQIRTDRPFLLCSRFLYPVLRKPCHSNETHILFNSFSLRRLDDSSRRASNTRLREGRWWEILLSFPFSLCCFGIASVVLKSLLLYYDFTYTRSFSMTRSSLSTKGWLYPDRGRQGVQGDGLGRWRCRANCYDWGCGRWMIHDDEHDACMKWNGSGQEFFCLPCHVCLILNVWSGSDGYNVLIDDLPIFTAHVQILWFCRLWDICICAKHLLKN